MLAYCGQYREWNFNKSRMSEKKIIEYIKKNKHRGVCLAYFPEGVMNWINDNRKDLLVLNEHIGYGLRVSPYDTTCWNKYDDDIGIYSHSIVTLPDDYIIKGETNGKKI